MRKVVKSHCPSMVCRLVIYPSQHIKRKFELRKKNLNVYKQIILAYPRENHCHVPLIKRNML